LDGSFSLTDGFNAKRDRGIHGGYDFAAPIGTPVKAPGIIGGGLIVAEVVSDQSKSHSGNGNRVVLRGKDPLGNDVEWQFNHLSEINPELAVGASVAAGVPLGKTGNTGTVKSSHGGNGAHLDLKIRMNGKLIEPTKYYEMFGQKQEAKTEPKTETKETAGLTPEQVKAMSADELMDYVELTEGW
jgi:murein DD-endopeptidase MepM/ murein hydrolase activator NlpD